MKSPAADAVGLEFPELKRLSRFRKTARERLNELSGLLSKSIPNYTSEDTSVVVFGSLARGEWTSGSDLDWTYLIDGQANSDHLLVARRIRRTIAKRKRRFRPPGRTGTFGNLAFSHEIIHQIGGEYDTNRNTTQRILLLLESKAVGKDGAYDRVVKGVINRYIEEDNHLLTEKGDQYRVPRFLLNDIVRFWRIMAVDFASKQRDRGGAGWGLRNAKLRMSRKLIFASGLLLCFGCTLNSELQGRISSNQDETKAILVNYLRKQAERTATEILAEAVREYKAPRIVGKRLFGAYSDFLKILDDEESRKVLKNLRSTQSRINPVFEEVRQISRRFQDALNSLFFDNKRLLPLIREYGVF
jgi:predicted nucleotidyltransferase